MTIRFVDLQRQYLRYKKEIQSAMEEVLLHSDFILGKALGEFESSFGKHTGTEFAVGVDSGTSALKLSLKALGIGPGDEVITAPNSYFSSAFVISDLGADVKFVDVNVMTQLLDTSLLGSALTSKTKAIIPVHLTGQMAVMDEINAFAEINGLYVVEDACQAHGSMQRGVRAGASGILGCFSFYPGKNLGAYGDAGAVTTNDENLYKKLILLRNYGSSTKYYHKFLAGNARLDTIQAAVLNVKLKYLDEWNARRSKIAKLYINNLWNIGDIILPYTEKYNNTNYHLFVIRTKKRDALFKYLNENNIQTVIHYPVPIHLQEAYSFLGLGEGSFPVAEMLAKDVLSLPIHPDLTDDEAVYVCEMIARFFRHKFY